ncbi:MAG: hypothetical protein MZU97_01810 [Bacillus subtilis]|nr:hypothetical protein [Bacillus subtilis]
MKRIALSVIILMFLACLVFVNNNACENKPNREVQASEHFKKSSFPISVINPTPKTNPLGAFYPGIRATNQLIIYTPLTEKEHQPMNTASEAVVINNIVSEKTGNNSLIPANGFVISGHGSIASRTNIAVGSVISIDEKAQTITSVITPESDVYKASQKIQSVNNLIADYKKNAKNYDFKQAKTLLDNAEKALNKAKESLKQQEYNRVKELSDEAFSIANKALYNAMPAVENEFKGIWVRPVEKNQQDIEKTLDRIKQAGITNVFWKLIITVTLYIQVKHLKITALDLKGQNLEVGIL